MIFEMKIHQIQRVSLKLYKNERLERNFRFVEIPLIKDTHSFKVFGLNEL